MVKKAFSRGTLILTEMDGDELPNPINFDAMKKILRLNGVSRTKSNKNNKMKKK